jgi:hypothetical protein
MPKRVLSCVPTVFAALLAAAAVLGTDHATLAADDCLAGPNRPPAPGGHWYFHLDRANDRKCWYLVEPAARVPTADATETHPVDTTPQPTLGSFFSSMGLPGTTTPQPDTTNGIGRTPEATRPDDPKGNAAPGPRPRIARHPDAQAALAQKPRRVASVPTEHADEHASSEQAERDALFQEFLRWRERKAQ